jgi:hypothetical protein
MAMQCARYPISVPPYSSIGKGELLEEMDYYGIHWIKMTLEGKERKDK